MKLAFAGTPEFAVPALDALIAAGHEVRAVFTQPDRPAGRGRAVQAAPVARRAAALELPLRQPAKFTAEAVAGLEQLAVDALVVVAYGLILPPAALATPRLGCFNIHASLLPRWRGAAPIQHAILAGDRETGVTIMRMDAGLDTGPMLLREALPIAPGMSAGDLHDALAPLGARLMVQALEALARGAAREIPQPEGGVTYARKISKDEARLDWSRGAEELERAVRAYNPAPVAWTELDGERVRIYRAAAAPDRAAAPGTIVSADAAGIHVATGAGTLVVAELQWPGGKPLTAAAAITSRSLGGRRFG
jgi:methionyl-tRNA formyltransferase